MRRWFTLVGILGICLCGVIFAIVLFPTFRRERLGIKLFYAAADGDLDKTRLLVKRGAPINYANSRMFEETPLIMAIHALNFDIVRFLVESGADVNEAEAHGMTPLMECTYSGNDSIEIVGFLLAHGARLDIKDKSGMTIFDYLVRQPDKVQLFEVINTEQNRRLAAPSSSSTNSTK